MSRIKLWFFTCTLWLSARPWVIALLLGMTISEPSQAVGCGNMTAFNGFTNLLGSVATFLTGGFGKAAVIIAVAIFGALMLFGELKGIFGTGIKILFGGSLVLMAVQWAGVFGSFGGTSACNYINGVQ